MDRMKEVERNLIELFGIPAESERLAVATWDVAENVDYPLPDILKGVGVSPKLLKEKNIPYFLFLKGLEKAKGENGSSEDVSSKIQFNIVKNWKNCPLGMMNDVFLTVPENQVARILEARFPEEVKRKEKWLTGRVVLNVFRFHENLKNADEVYREYGEFPPYGSFHDMKEELLSGLTKSQVEYAYNILSDLTPEWMDFSEYKEECRKLDLPFVFDKEYAVFDAVLEFLGLDEEIRKEIAFAIRKEKFDFIEFGFDYEMTITYPPYENTDAITLHFSSMHSSKFHLDLLEVIEDEEVKRYVRAFVEQYSVADFLCLCSEI